MTLLLFTCLATAGDAPPAADDPIELARTRASTVQEVAGTLDQLASMEQPKLLADDATLWERQTVWLRTVAADLRQTAVGWQTLVDRTVGKRADLDPADPATVAMVEQTDDTLHAELVKVQKAGIRDVPRDPLRTVAPAVDKRGSDALRALKSLSSQPFSPQ